MANLIELMSTDLNRCLFKFLLKVIYKNLLYLSGSSLFFDRRSFIHKAFIEKSYHII